MAAGTAAQVDKKAYKNQTAGYIGVVKLDHLGAQVGFSVPPHGTVWLSDDEAQLTARAPALPENNPFVEKTYDFIENDTGRAVQAQMAPLVAVTDERYDPSQDRFVPGHADINVAAVQGNRANTAGALQGDGDRPVSDGAAAPEGLSPAAAVPAAHSGPAPESDDAEPESWVTEDPDRTEAPQPGTLAGAPAVTTEATTTKAPSGPPPQAPAPQPVVTAGNKTVPSESAGVAESAGSPSEQAAAADVSETASTTEAGEETGASATPVGDPPTGEFAAAEEVGSPDAAAAQGES